jgi:deoxyribodipyrimidine photo-lyase
MQRYNCSLFIFRRDLRLPDNTGLNAALRQSRQVMACFMFDPRQVEAHAYQSQPGLQFMQEAVTELQQEIVKHGGKLYLLFGRPDQLLQQLQQQHAIQAVFVNRDYTPFSRQRDQDLQQQCLQLGLDFHSHDDLLLNAPEQVLKVDGSAYQQFTAFYNRARPMPVNLPQPLAVGHLLDIDVDAADLLQRFKQPHSNLLPGGRRAAMDILENKLVGCQQYQQQRDFPVQAATSTLSAYLKFGCCSVREVFWAIQQVLGAEHALIRQLYWRDFFTHIGFHYPQVFGHAFQSRYDNIAWENDEQKFWAWAKGQTGFPLVDAAMRELLQTGWMHNRLRMVVASFLVKDLHISWRWGERYFAQHLLDYDPCVNNGNWQWAASTGCDAQPYFRIFNPWLQQRKFDAQCLYIKRWLPELQAFTPKEIHAWPDKPQVCAYPAPIVDHARQSLLAKRLFQAVVQNE